MKAFLIHGSYGHPEENWFPWLKQKLEEAGWKVFVPTFPTPKNQSLNTWQKAFAPYRSEIDETSIFIGHSLGPAFILSILEDLDFQIPTCFFVAGFTGNLNNPEFDEINKTIADKNFNWDQIKANCSHFNLYHSDNDPYVPLTKAEALSQQLNSKLTIIPNAGHFNTSSSYNDFIGLLEDIQST